MSWFRLDDRAIDHPKFLSLSDGAFRLWIEGGCYCNRHLTDGLVHGPALQGFRYATKKRLAELVQMRLWDPCEDGYLLHDYLDWNESKATIEAQKAAGRERTRRWRDGPRDVVRDASHYAYKHSGMGIGSTLQRKVNGEVSGSDPFNDSAITERAGRFIERYQSLYQAHRKARYLVREHRDYQAAVPLCATWTDDARLDKLAVVFLKTDHDFAENGSRTIPQFAALASWCDSKLAEWEAKRA